ncbi:MAG: deoxyguanosinetriphosphate triphosphohydrolase [Chloroflexi bacterium]|nr:deoxyguanosinetriphosphate triphosphohydrolase [Chloroflexota bacterium]
MAGRPDPDSISSTLDSVRKRLEEREETLSPFATRSARCLGRSAPEEPSPVRTEFQRDRDRIIHTTSFRRLKHKSQVFIAPMGDHYVTRLTHTIEVSQIGRTIARALNLNEDLVEAIATGHDIGHTPFGHVGERVLDELLPGGFHHSRHSVRIVECLEKGGRGLNLTRDVVEGIRRHSKPQGAFLDASSVQGMSLEAQIVRISDAVAYLNHDIGDALRAGMITVDDLPPDAIGVLGRGHSERVNTLVTDIIATSWAATGLVSPLAGAAPVITMSQATGDAMTALRDFMFDRVYLPLGDAAEGAAAQEITALLFRHYVDHPGDIVPEFLRPESSPERMAADMVCGMTDQYAVRTAERIRPGISRGLFEGRL